MTDLIAKLEVAMGIAYAEGYHDNEALVDRIATALRQAREEGRREALENLWKNPLPAGVYTIGPDGIKPMYPTAMPLPTPPGDDK